MTDPRIEFTPWRRLALATVALVALAVTACSGPGAQVTPITEVNVSAVAGGVLIEWSGGEGATSFSIFRSSEDVGSEEIASVPGDRRSYADYTAEPGVEYRYAVVARGPGAAPEPTEQSQEDPVTPLDGVLLSIVLDGDGSVTVEGAAAPVSCVTDCVVGFEDGAEAVLTGVGDGLAFAGFSSPCPPTASCSLKMEGDLEVVALFRMHVLRVSLEGGATTQVAASPPDDRGVVGCVLEAGNDCLLGYTYSGGPSLQVSINATVTQAGASFAGFAGACANPQGSFCLVDVAGATEVIVRAAAVPVAEPDSYRVPQVGSVTMEAPGVLGNDARAPSAAADLLEFTGPGDLDLRPDGSFTYEGDGVNQANVTFTYRVAGPFSLVSQPASVTLEVAPLPVAVADSYTTNEDVQLTVGPGSGLHANDEHAEDATTELMSQPAQGSVSLGQDGGFVYTPPKDWNGQTSFTYRLVGEFGMTSETATVTITVNPVNDPPTFTLSQTELVTGFFQSVTIEGFATNISPGGGTDEADQLLVFDVDRQPGGGNPGFVLAPAIDPITGTLTFQSGFQAGTWTWEVTLVDNGGGTNTSAITTFTITVQGGGGGGDGD